MHPNRYLEAKKVTLIGAVINLLLGIIKLLVGIATHSHALIADGIHSLSDLLTDAMVIVASKYGSQTADLSHPYGHQRIETAATFLLAQLLILTGFGIAFSACEAILYHPNTIPGWFAVPIALLSLIANEILFYYTRYKGQQIQSNLLIANAWHHRSDAVSSLVVALGILASLLGYVYFDALAAIIVGILISKMGFVYLWNSIKELVDTAPNADLLQKIKEIIAGVEGVEKLHRLRSRHMSNDIFIDVHILVPPFISVSEGHFIAQHVHQTLRQECTQVKDVTVHVDSEDDEEPRPSLPSRTQLATSFKTFDPDFFTKIDQWDIHYWNGCVYLDILPTKDASEEAITATLKNTCATFSNIAEIRLVKKKVV